MDNFCHTLVKSASSILQYIPMQKKMSKSLRKKKLSFFFKKKTLKFARIAIVYCFLSLYWRKKKERKKKMKKPSAQIRIRCNSTFVGKIYKKKIGWIELTTTEKMFFFFHFYMIINEQWSQLQKKNCLFIYCEVHSCICFRQMQTQM